MVALSRATDTSVLTANSAPPGSHDSMYASAGDPFPVGTAAFMPGMSARTDIDPANVWNGTGSPLSGPFTSVNPMAAGLSQMRQDIIKNREASVVQRFGQITPPDDNTLELGPRKTSSQSNSSQPPKLDKSERARNAAIQRHSKKRQQQRQERQDSLALSEEDAEDKREKYREKNRLAAAKCRQKKKENTEGLEEDHREKAAVNNILRREERELRNQLSELRTLALQHDPCNGQCQCADLHHYNAMQAKRLAKDAYGSVSSPATTDGFSAAPSPRVMDGMGFGRTVSMPGTSPVPTLGMVHRPQSFAAQSAGGFGQVTSPSMMQSQTVTSAQSDGNIHGFSGYLQHSSPGGGRAGFDHR
jgi:hypothetical protein